MKKRHRDSGSYGAHAARFFAIVASSVFLATGALGANSMASAASTYQQSNLQFTWNGVTYTFSDPSLVLAMNFNGNGTAAEDISGYGNNGALQNGAKYVPGMFGSSTGFDGINDRILVQDSPSMNPAGAITIEGWVKFDTMSQPNRWPMLVSKQGGSTGNRTGYDLVFSNSSKKVKAEFWNGYQIQLLSTKANWAAGKWYHIAATYDKSGGQNNVKLYVDGVLDAQATDSRGWANYAGPLAIGSGSSGNYFKGAVDEIRVYSRALAPDEIKAKYRSEFQRAGSLPTTQSVSLAPVTVTSPQPVQQPAPVVVPPAPAPAPSSVSVSGAQASDNFNGYAQNQLITDWKTYNWADFPGAGSSGSGNPSKIWETDTGGFRADNGWGFTGKPDAWADRYFFRMNTRDSSIKDQIVSFDYKSAPFGQDGYSVEGPDAVDVWLRYQSQYWLYIIQIDRTNNGIVAKRKVPAEGWSGPSNQISNRGVYYTLKTDSSQPIFGAGQQFISWAGVKMPNLAHDGTPTGGTKYHFDASVKTIPGTNKVQLQLKRDGVLVGSWTDNNDGTSANGQTFQQHWNAGYYKSVTGYNPAWGLPINAAGKSGMRADNIKAWFDNFVLKSA